MRDRRLAPTYQTAVFALRAWTQRHPLIRQCLLWALPAIAFGAVLRGLLLTGLSPRFLRSDVLDGSSEVDMEPLWWPPGKIAGRYLAPFLAEHFGLSTEPPPGLLDEAGAREIEVELAVRGGGAHDAR